MPELLFLMYFTFLVYISANIMSVWHLVHRKAASTHFNLLFPLFSQMFAFCLPLSLKLSLKPKLLFLVESLQLHETCRTQEHFTSPRSKLQPSSVWTAHVGRDSCVDPFGKGICPPGGSSGASYCPGQSRDQAVGKCLPWLCHPLRCCFPWHQMHAEIGSRKAMQLFGIVHSPVFFPASASLLIV